MFNEKELKRIAELYNKQEGQRYPCSNQIVRCGVITRDKDKALSIMNDKGATLIKKGSHFLEWELDNERWIWTHWSYSIRGYRFYKIIVDKNTDMSDDDFQSVLNSCGLYCCSFEIV